MISGSTFSKLPLLDTFVHDSTPGRMEAAGTTLLVCVQHMLETTGSLFAALLRLGFRPSNIHVLGKAYSSHAPVEDGLRSLGLDVHPARLGWRPGTFGEHFHQDCLDLWQVVAERCKRKPPSRIVILDDGGHCLESTPEWIASQFPIVGVEQTTNGLVRTWERCPFPIVEVASSAAKVKIEPPMITRAVIGRARRILEGSGLGRRLGVVGIGNIGESLARDLAGLGHRVSTYDRTNFKILGLDGITPRENLIEVLRNSDVVFGCTGEDIFAEIHGVDSIALEVDLVSCSSEDMEFRTLLSQGDVRGNPFSDLRVQVGLSNFRILRGGFPINFDGSAESVPGEEIQLTRRLLLAGIVQAMWAKGRRTNIMLDPEAQRLAVNEWFNNMPDRRNDYGPDLLQGFKDTDWIRAMSGGSWREGPYRGRRTGS